MLSASFLAELHCPYCAGPLQLETLLKGNEQAIEHAVVRCQCYRYPIIDGIIALRQHSGVASIADVRVQHLLAGEFDAALAAAMDAGVPPPPPERGLGAILKGALRKLPGMTDGRRPAADLERRGAEFQAVLNRWRPGLYGQYLYQRYANNSFHASVPLLLLLGELGACEPAPRVLELACGIGHSAFLMSATFPYLDIVATDFDFTNLWIAKRFFAPNARLVCLDAEVPLPFRDGAFSAVFCLDGFHYVRSKVALGMEAVRVGADDALLLFPHLHNANQHNINAGIPLTPEGYRRCFDSMPCRLYDETLVLRDYVRDGAFAIDEAGAPEKLAQAQSLALVATRREDFWRRRNDLAAALCADPSQLMPNPLYEVTRGAGFVDLTSNWPNAALETECQPVKAYLPAALRLEATLLACLDGAAPSQECMAQLKDLVQRFALVRLPGAAFARRWNDAPVRRTNPI